MFKFNAYDSDSPIPPPQRLEHRSFPKGVIALQFQIPQRELNAINVYSYLNEEIHAAQIRLVLPLLEGKESREVQETYEIPRYSTVTEFTPETTRDKIFDVINIFVSNLNHWMQGIRDSGRLFSRFQITDVERWLLRAELPVKLRKFQYHKLVKKEKIDRVTIIKTYCPHHHSGATGRDCVDFLGNFRDARTDASYLRAAAGTLKDITDSIANDKELHYMFLDRGKDRFVFALSKLQHLTKRYS